MADDTGQFRSVQTLDHEKDETKIKDVLLKSSTKKKKRKKIDLNSSRHRLFHKSSRFNSSNLSLMRQTLKANNRDLAKALQNVKEELNLSIKLNLELQEERQALRVKNNTLTHLASINNENMEKDVLSRVKARMSEVRGVLNKVSTNLLSTVNLLSEALKMSTDPERESLETYCQRIAAGSERHSSIVPQVQQESPEESVTTSSIFPLNSSLFSSINRSSTGHAPLRVRREPMRITEDLQNDMSMIHEATQLMADDSILFTEDAEQADDVKKEDEQFDHVTSRHRRSKSKRSSSLRNSVSRTSDSELALLTGDRKSLSHNGRRESKDQKRKTSGENADKQKKSSLTVDMKNTEENSQENINLIMPSGVEKETLHSSVTVLENVANKSGKNSRKLRSSSSSVKPSRESEAVTANEQDSDISSGSSEDGKSVKSPEGTAESISIISHENSPSASKCAVVAANGKGKETKKSKLPKPVTSQQDKTESPGMRDEMCQDENPFDCVTQIYELPALYNLSKKSKEFEKLSGETIPESTEMVPKSSEIATKTDDSDDNSDALFSDKGGHNFLDVGGDEDMSKIKSRRETFVKIPSKRVLDKITDLSSFSAQETGKTSTRRETFIKVPKLKENHLESSSNVMSTLDKKETSKNRRGTYFVPMSSSESQSTNEESSVNKTDHKHIGTSEKKTAKSVSDNATMIAEELVNVDEMLENVVPEFVMDDIDSGEPLAGKPDASLATNFLNVDYEPTLYFNTDMELTEVIPQNFSILPPPTGPPLRDPNNKLDSHVSEEDSHPAESKESDKATVVNDLQQTNSNKLVEEENPFSKVKRKSFKNHKLHHKLKQGKVTEAKQKQTSPDAGTSSSGSKIVDDFESPFKKMKSKNAHRSLPGKILETKQKQTKSSDASENSSCTTTADDSSPSEKIESKTADQSSDSNGSAKPKSKFVAYSKKPGTIVFSSEQGDSKSQKKHKPGHSRSKSRPGTIQMKPRSRPRSKTANIDIKASKEPSIFDFLSPGRTRRKSKNAYDLSMNESIHGPLPSLADMRDKAGIPTSITVEGLLSNEEKPKSILLVDKVGKRTKPRARSKTVSMTSPQPEVKLKSPVSKERHAKDDSSKVLSVDSEQTPTTSSLLEEANKYSESEVKNNLKDKSVEQIVKKEDGFSVSDHVDGGKLDSVTVKKEASKSKKRDSSVKSKDTHSNSEISSAGDDSNKRISCEQSRSRASHRKSIKQSRHLKTTEEKTKPEDSHKEENVQRENVEDDDKQKTASRSSLEVSNKEEVVKMSTNGASGRGKRRSTSADEDKINRKSLKTSKVSTTRKSARAIDVKSPEKLTIPEPRDALFIDTTSPKVHRESSVSTPVSQKSGVLASRENLNASPDLDLMKRPRRATVAVKSYKEPSVGSKLRQGDPIACSVYSRPEDQTAINNLKKRKSSLSKRRSVQKL